MITVWGSVVAAEGNVEELLAISLAHVRRSRQEEGCVAHGAYVDAEDANRVVFFEKWESAAALRRHFAVPASIEFARRAGALAAERPVMEIYTSDRVSPSDLA
ncbi:MAG: putative quinol monooxygenase [Myxococcota bacterium]